MCAGPIFQMTGRYQKAKKTLGKSKKNKKNKDFKTSLAKGGGAFHQKAKTLGKSKKIKKSKKSKDFQTSLARPPLSQTSLKIFAFFVFFYIF